MLSILEKESNYLVLQINNIQLLFSYKTCVAGYLDGDYFKTENYYSRTTSKHINRYLGNRSAFMKKQNQIEELINKIKYE